MTVQEELFWKSW